MTKRIDGYSCNKDQIRYLTLLAKNLKNPNARILNFCSSQRLKPSSTKQNQRKIGVILPLKGSMNAVGIAVKNGIEKAINKKNLRDTIIIVRQDNTNLNLLDKTIARMVLTEQVSVLVGGISTKTASRIKYWSQNIGVPSILFSGKVSISPKENHVFKITPDPKDLTDALAKEALSRGYKTIAALTPNNTKEYDLVPLIVNSFESNKIKLVRTAHYNPTNYESMELAARTLMHLKPQDRPQELTDLMRKKRLEASLAKKQFNPHMISLLPKIDFDAIFISDHFRNVKYFVKIFKYLGAKKTPLFGNHQWRSQTLLKPFDRYLNHSFFYDFIGRYDQLPRDLNAPNSKSPYFTEPSDAQSLDYEIMGYRSVEIASRALRSYYSTAQLWKALELVQDKKSRFFPHGYAFKKNHYARWPKHIISLIDGRPNLYRVK